MSIKFTFLFDMYVVRNIYLNPQIGSFPLVHQICSLPSQPSLYPRNLFDAKLIWIHPWLITRDFKNRSPNFLIKDIEINFNLTLHYLD